MNGIEIPVGFYQKKIIVMLMILLAFSVNSHVMAEDEEEEEPKVIRQGPPPLEKPQYLDLGTFVVNMPGDKYYLKSSIQLAFEDPAPKAWMQARMPIVKDLIITHLHSVTVSQFDDLKNRAVIKKNLQIRLNSLFPSKAPWDDFHPIRKILFMEFYRQ